MKNNTTKVKSVPDVKQPAKKKEKGSDSDDESEDLDYGRTKKHIIDDDLKYYGT